VCGPLHLVVVDAGADCIVDNVFQFDICCLLVG